MTNEDRRKGAALRKRMRDQEFTQKTFALAINYRSRQMISKWWKGEGWPTDLEPTMETVLHLPLTFFAQVGKGVPYLDALKLPFTDRRKEKASTLSTEQQIALGKQIMVIEQDWRVLAEMLAAMGITATIGGVGESEKAV